MEKHPGPGVLDDEQSILDEDMLYPNCPKCHIDLFVETNPRGEEMFHCLRCRRPFDPNITSKWFGVDALLPSHRRDYIAIEIRGYSMKRWAKHASVKRDTVKRNVNRAKKIIEAEKEKNGVAILDGENGVRFED